MYSPKSAIASWRSTPPKCRLFGRALLLKLPHVLRGNSGGLFDGRGESSEVDVAILRRSGLSKLPNELEREHGESTELGDVFLAAEKSIEAYTMPIGLLVHLDDMAS